MIEKLFYLSRHELINMLNDKNVDVYTKIIISTVIIYKTSDWFIIKDESLLESASVELFFKSLKKVITISDVTKLINSEINIFASLFITDKFKSEFDLESLYSSGFNDKVDTSIVLSLLKENILNICPEKYKIIISVLLETGELYYDNYNYYDKIFINTFLNSIGYSLETNINIPLLSKLDTLQKKAIFLFYLNSRSKDLFTLLVSLKSLSSLFIFLDSMSDNPNIIGVIEAIDIIESCVSSSILTTSENIFSNKEEKELFFSMIKDIILNKEISNKYTDLLKDGITLLDELHQDELSKQISANSSNFKKLGFLANKLKQEISDQINVANLINKI